MNPYQELWWQQAQSDLTAFLLLQRHGADPCQQIHYLQMVTEKLGKAYLWRSGIAPPRSHAGFVQFMRSLGGAGQQRGQQIAAVLGFKSFPDLQGWIRAALPLIYELERLAPALAQDGPNPEYPWPHAAPVNTPARHQFTVWVQITGSTRARQLLKVIQSAVGRFPTYA